MSARPQRSALAKLESRQALGFASPALVGLAIFTFVPLCLSIIMGFFDWPTFGERSFNGVDNYIKLFTNSPDFWPALRNTAVYTIAYVPLNIFFSLLLALSLGSRIIGRNVLRVLFFIPVVTPMVAN
ncbi:MAG: sugar ABC transporter permease, partial [Propionibacteriaceae bacterium]|nr:sugar ABC transporter permease [Propionibacteriaceae bacterium]